MPMPSSSWTPGSTSPFTSRLPMGSPSFPFPVYQSLPPEGEDVVVSPGDTAQRDRRRTESPSGTSHSPVSGPSALSILMANASPRSTLASDNTTPRAPASPTDASNQPLRSTPSQVPSSIFNTPSKNLSSSDERTPLLRHISEESYSAPNIKSSAVSSAPASSLPPPSSSSAPTFAKSTPGRLIARAKSAARIHFTPAALRESGTIAIKSLPAVLLGSLLNILDGVSCEQCCFLVFMNMGHLPASTYTRLLKTLCLHLSLQITRSCVLCTRPG
jgi:hypothetical protein